MSGNVEHREYHHHHHHHHYHHHYHYHHNVPEGFQGPRPDQHFNPHPQESGSGADYWGNFGVMEGDEPQQNPRAQRGPYPPSGGPSQGYGNMGGPAGGPRGYGGPGNPY